MAKEKKTIKTFAPKENIKTCKCNHEYQDEKYGEHKRLHNPTIKGQWRCTVCENIRGD